MMAEWLRPGVPVVMIAAGLHGDEPAAPWALFDLAAGGLLDDRFGYRIWPCLNPSGYEAGTRIDAEGHDPNRMFGRGGRTPETKAVLTANRDRRFTLAIDLHEDPEAAGAYCYEALVPGAVCRFAPSLVAALDDAGLPVQDLDGSFDLGVPVAVAACSTLSRGTVVVDAACETAAFGDDLPLTLALLRRGADATLTIESPGLRPWDERIAVHRVAVTTALSLLARAPRGAATGSQTS